MSEYSLFERKETVQSDLGYDYTVVQIEVSVEMDWASFSVVSHITYFVQREMRALMGNNRRVCTTPRQMSVPLMWGGPHCPSNHCRRRTGRTFSSTASATLLLLRESPRACSKSSDSGSSVLLQSNQQTCLKEQGSGGGSLVYERARRLEREDVNM